MHTASVLKDSLPHLSHVFLYFILPHRDSMGKKGLRKAGAAGLDPEERMALEEEDEFAKELAAAEEIRREQALAGGGGANMDDEDDDEDEDEDDETALQPRPREFLNNQNGLRQVLVEIETANGPRPWPETMEVCQFPLGLEDVHDDLARETAFYRVALAAVKEGRARLAQHKVPYKRPEDFFCDMLKSDDHMARVRFWLNGKEGGGMDGLCVWV